MRKILLDENLPVRLKYRLLESGFDAQTVRENGWNGVLNGALLQLAAGHGFAVFVTADKQLPYQQNTANLPVAVVVLNVPTLNYSVIQPLLPVISEALNNAVKGSVTVVP